MVLCDTLETDRRAPESEFGVGETDGSILGTEVFSDVLVPVPGVFMFTWPKLTQRQVALQSTKKYLPWYYRPRSCLQTPQSGQPQRLGRSQASLIPSRSQKT